MTQNSGSFHIKTQPGGTSTTQFTVTQAGNISFGSYGSGSKTGTAAYNLQVDSSGNIIE